MAPLLLSGRPVPVPQFDWEKKLGDNFRLWAHDYKVAVKWQKHPVPELIHEEELARLVKTAPLVRNELTPRQIRERARQMKEAFPNYFRQRGEANILSDLRYSPKIPPACTHGERMRGLLIEALRHEFAAGRSLAKKLGLFRTPVAYAYSIVGSFELAEVSEQEIALRLSSWCRYGRPLTALMREAENDKEARVKIGRLRLVAERWSAGKVELSDLRGKMDVNHFVLLAAGLGSGLERLTESELEKFLDKYCPACSPPKRRAGIDPADSRHLARSAGKLRTKIISELQQIGAWPSRKIISEPEQAKLASEARGSRR